jgi:hypothetical protein
MTSERYSNAEWRHLQEPIFGTIAASAAVAGAERRLAAQDSVITRVWGRSPACRLQSHRP